MGLFVLLGGQHSQGAVQALLFHQSTQAMVAYSTSAMVRSGSVWKGPGRTHSVLYRPMIDSMGALS